MPPALLRPLLVPLLLTLIRTLCPRAIASVARVEALPRPIGSVEARTSGRVRASARATLMMLPTTGVLGIAADIAEIAVEGMATAIGETMIEGGRVIAVGTTMMMRATGPAADATEAGAKAPATGADVQSQFQQEGALGCWRSRRMSSLFVLIVLCVCDVALRLLDLLFFGVRVCLCGL